MKATPVSKPPLPFKIVLITGANSGIGAACAHHFAALGARLILTARRQETVQPTIDAIIQRYHTPIHTLLLDVRDTEHVLSAVQQLPAPWQSIDVLINNAGLSKGLDGIQVGNPTDWDLMIDTNVKGLLAMTRAVLPGMLKRQQGHIINIGSIAGLQVYPGGAVYCATKFAVRAISEGIKMDVHGTPIRVTTLHPGMVKTAFSTTRFNGDTQKADAVYQGVQALTADDIADAVVYCATRPPHVDVREMTVMPTDQTASHMVHRI